LRSPQRQALAAQIGQVQGNRHLQRVIVACRSGNESFVQRDTGGTGNKATTEGKGSTSVGEGAIKQTVSVSRKFETPEKTIDKLKCKVKGSATISGSLTVEIADPTKTPGKSELTNTAVEFGTEHSQKLWEADYSKEAGELQSAEVSLKEGAKGNPFDEKSGGEVSIGAEAKVVTKTGVTASAELTVFKIGASTEGFPFDVTIGELSLSEKMSPIKIPEGTEFKGYKFSGGLDVTYTFTVSPDKSEIAREIMTKYGPGLLGRLGITPLNAVRSIMASGPAMVGFFGAYVTIKAALATLEDWDDMKRIAAAAREASEGYIAGFMFAISGSGNAGEAAWYAEGINRGRAALDAQIRRIQNEPMFREFHFTDAELRPVIKDAVAANREMIFKTVYESADPQIKAAFVQKWDDNLSLPQKIFTNTDRDKAQLKTMLGLKDTEPLPKTDIEPPGVAPGPAPIPPPQPSAPPAPAGKQAAPSATPAPAPGARAPEPLPPR